MDDKMVEFRGYRRITADQTFHLNSEPRLNEVKKKSEFKPSKGFRVRNRNFVDSLLHLRFVELS